MRKFIKITENLEKLGLFNGQTIEASDFDAVTGEWIIRPSAVEQVLSPNIRLKKDLHCKIAFPVCMPEDTYKTEDKVVIHVFTEGNRRFVEAIGYVYSNGESGTDEFGDDNPDYTYRIVEFRKNEMLLANYLVHNIEDLYIDTLGAGSNLKDATELQAFWWLNAFNNITVLGKEQLTETTPDGWYLY